jgi:GntR family transcriptional repressor for pyruvate dehydrogenase complex
MKKIERVSITTQTAESIRESIISGQFPVAGKLPAEAKLGELLSVGRSSIREALRQLQAEGYVDLLAGRGAFVRDNQRHDYDTVRRWFISATPKLEDFTEVREALEPLAVKMAIQRLSAGELRALQKIHADFANAAEKNNVAALAQLDEKFHTQIVTMAHNALLAKLSDMLNAELKEYRIRSIAVKPNSANTVREHEKILRHIQNRDEKRGAAAMLAHLRMVLNEMRKVVGEGKT